MVQLSDQLKIHLKRLNSLEVSVDEASKTVIKMKHRLGEKLQNAKQELSKGYEKAF